MTTYLAAAESNMSVIILITGFVVVFAVLVLLIGIIWAYSKIVSSAQTKAQKRNEKKQANITPAQEETLSVALVNETSAASDGSLDLQTVAVITAAVEAFYGSKKKVRIKGIRPATSARSEWATAGVLENMPAMRSEGLL